MSEPSKSLLEQASTSGVGQPRNAKHLRFLELLLVLAIALPYPLLGTLYVVLGGTTFPDSIFPIRIAAALLAELSSLAVLWYVLFRQNRNWQAIGCSLQPLDALRAIALLAGGLFVGYVTYFAGQYLYYSIFGHYLIPKSVHALIGMRISVLSVIFMCVNPFFEELIVRAYTMTEVVALGGSPVLAVVVSMFLQLSYHLYQGIANVFVISGVFLVFSIYFARSRKAMPIVFAHLFLDLYSLLRS